MSIIKIILSFFLLAQIISIASAAQVSVLPSNQKVSPGETFDLNIRIDPMSAAIAGAQLNFAFNNSVLKVNNVKEGNLFNQNGASTFFNSGIINNSTGMVINIFTAIIGKNNISTPGVFVVINFTVVSSSGFSQIDLSNVKISDPNGIAVLFNIVNGSINVNSPPVLASIGTKQVFKYQNLTFTLSATDINGDLLTYSASNLPTGASFNTSTATFLWKPTNFGLYQRVHFEVSDGITTDFEDISIIVNNPAEIAVSPALKNVSVGQNFNIDVMINPNGTPIAGAQLNLAFNKSLININNISEGNLFKQSGSNTLFNSGIIDNSKGTVINIYGTIMGSTNVSTQGTFITINATVVGLSGSSGIDLSNIIISDPQGAGIAYNAVNGRININNPPVFAAIGNRTAYEGQLLTFAIIASDPNGDTLTYSASNLPSGATFNSRTFKWTPTFTQAGTYSNIHFEVTDGSLKDSKNITIIVDNVNRAPTFNASPADSSIFNETDIIYISAAATDLDNDTISYIIRIDGIQVGTSPSYNWSTDYSSSGNHVVNISVTDCIAVVSKTIAIYINNVYPRYDVNENGKVDIGDLTLIGQHFNERVTAPYPRYDVNMDGVVNIVDIAITGQHFGENT